MASSAELSKKTLLPTAESLFAVYRETVLPLPTGNALATETQTKCSVEFASFVQSLAYLLSTHAEVQKSQVFLSIFLNKATEEHKKVYVGEIRALPQLKDAFVFCKQLNVKTEEELAREALLMCTPNGLRSIVFQFCESLQKRAEHLQKKRGEILKASAFASAFASEAEAEAPTQAELDVEMLCVKAKMFLLNCLGSGDGKTDVQVPPINAFKTLLVFQEPQLHCLHSLSAAYEGLALAQYATTYAQPDKTSSLVEKTRAFPIFRAGGESTTFFESPSSGWTKTAYTTLNFVTTLDVFLQDAQVFLDTLDASNTELVSASWPLLSASKGRWLVCSRPGLASCIEPRVSADRVGVHVDWDRLKSDVVSKSFSTQLGERASPLLIQTLAELSLADLI